MTAPIEIVDLDQHDPTDTEILSWWDMMAAPDQLQWEYDASWAAEKTTPQETIDGFRSRREKQRGGNHPLWALAGGQVIGMIGINRLDDPARSHCAEIGFGVLAEYRRRGVGRRLLDAAVAKARELGLRRGAICKDGALRDQRLLGLALATPSE